MSDQDDSRNIVNIDFRRIRNAAAKAGLSTRAIAVKAGGMAHSTVAGVLSGRTNPTAVNVKKICDVIGIPIQEIFIDRAA